MLVCFTTSCFWSDSSPRTCLVFRSNLIEGINQPSKEKSIQGFTDDLFLEIGRRKNIKFKITTIENAKDATLLANKGANAAIMTMVPAERSSKFYRFSDPFFSFGPVIVLRAGETMKNLAALKNKVVGFDRSYGSALEGKNDLLFIFQAYDQMTSAMEDLINGKLDAVLLDSNIAYQYAQSFYHGKITIITPPLKMTDLRLATKIDKKDDLIHLFNDGLKELRDQGTYKKMLDYWGLVDPTHPY